MNTYKKRYTGSRKCVGIWTEAIIYQSVNLGEEKVDNQAPLVAAPEPLLCEPRLIHNYGSQYIEGDLEWNTMFSLALLNNLTPSQKCAAGA